MRLALNDVVLPTYFETGEGGFHVVLAVADVQDADVQNDGGEPADAGAAARLRRAEPRRSRTA